MNIIPDISFWQNDPTTPRGVDFRVMRQKTPAVIVRAGQGTWKDNQFDYHWQGAKAEGMKRGSYWYYDNTINPKRQAEKWSEIMAGDLGELELYADFEDRTSSPFRGWKHWYDFMERFKQLNPTAKMGVYTGYYYFNEFAYGVDYFSQYPLWIAWYNLREPLIPHIWEDWTLWQYTSNGRGEDYGVESDDIDLNFCKIDFDTPTAKPRQMTVKIQERQAEYIEA